MSTLFPINLDSFLNPGALTNLDGTGSDPRLNHADQHTNVNDTLVSIENKIGVNFSSVNISLDYIVTLLLLTQTEHQQGVKREILGQPFPTNVIWYGDLGGTVKLVEKNTLMTPRKILQKLSFFCTMDLLPTF